MTWQLFTIIQISVFALAALAALGLRNLQLRRRTDQLMTLCGQAHDELVAVTTKLKDIETTMPPEKLLAERVKALTGEDPVVVVRRMVLQNEIKPRPGFVTELEALLASQTPDEEEFARRWRLIREECQQLAMFLVADKPDILNAIRQIFEVIEPLDQAYGLALPVLEAPPPKDEAPAEVSDVPGEPSAEFADELSAEPPAEPAAAPSPESSSSAAGDADSEELDQDALDALIAGAQGGAR